MLDAPYVLFATDQARVLRVLKNLRTPTNYVAARHAKINKGRLSGLKSHDYHILMQQVLPLCFWRVANKALVGAVIDLSRVFRKLCTKIVYKAEKEQMLADCAETMCMLEKKMPLAFFDIMSHLPYHFVEEVFLCGPVHTRWMYPYERYFKTV